jgi:hypothetical protein
MPAPEGPQELELVCKAISLAHIGGCLVWNEKEERQLRARPPIPDLFPDHVRKLLVDFVTNGGLVVQRKEARSDWQDLREYWYKAKIPFEGLPKGLFVEFWLKDDDPDYPVVELTNYHK